jgi:hypothetical protein
VPYIYEDAQAYDNKSDIWSLGCLVYELCALKPPFHEARTHAELATFIKNGRIPPLPRGYSSTLSSTIKAMLNLNVSIQSNDVVSITHHHSASHASLGDSTFAARTDRLRNQARRNHEGVRRTQDPWITVPDHFDRIANIKAHKEQVVQRERTVATREQALVRQECDIQALQQSLSNTQEQLSLAQAQVVQLQAALQEAQSQPSSSAELAVALAARDAQHAERAAAHDLEAVRARELELEAAWSAREAAILAQAKVAVEMHAKAIQTREAEVADAWERREEEIQKRWHEMEGELQARVKAKEADIERAWEEREEVLQREADERVREALLRARDISQKGMFTNAQ